MSLAGDDYELPPILYSTTTPRDAVMQLQRELKSGQVTLDRTSAWTMLRDLRARLEIPVESQVLVFSKTSKQNDRIHPQTPRAIYFGDNAYLGYAVGGAIELTTIDPVLGPVFYVLEPTTELRRPLEFQRDQSCLSCHGGVFTPGIPGVMVRSVFPSAQGHPIMSQGSTVVDTTTPFSDRWGGWYVTGRHGSAFHRGNVIATERADQTCDLPVKKGANVTALKRFFDTTPYPRKTSDIVALMVLEHQTFVQNVLTRANHTALRAIHMQTSLQRELGEPVSDTPTGTARRMIDHSAEDVLDALLFKDEAPLPEGGIEGDEAFQTAFGKSAPRSEEGRSLKDFQLLTRLFKYRCSFMIHSLSFTHLTPAMKETVLTRLFAVLEGEADTERYAYLSESERRHIRDILKQTLTLPSPSSP